MCAHFAPVKCYFRGVQWGFTLSVTRVSLTIQQRAAVLCVSRVIVFFTVCRPAAQSRSSEHSAPVCWLFLSLIVGGAAPLKTSPKSHKQLFVMFCSSLSNILQTEKVVLFVVSMLPAVDGSRLAISLGKVDASFFSKSGGFESLDQYKHLSFSLERAVSRQGKVVQIFCLSLGGWNMFCCCPGLQQWITQLLRQYSCLLLLPGVSQSLSTIGNRLTIHKYFIPNYKRGVGFLTTTLV